MRGIFCGCSVKTNEEFREVLRRRNKKLFLLVGLGILTAVAGFLAHFYFDAVITDRTLGLITGMGTGLFAAGIVLVIRNQRIMKDEEKLKKNRLLCTDERYGQISQNAFQAAAYVLLLGLYVIGIIGGMFYPILIKVMEILIVLFVVTYFIAYKIYEKKI